MSQIKLGAILNWSRMVMGMGIGFVLSPFILSHLGRSEFGIYSIAGTIVGWLAMCDFGLTSSTTKFISEYQAKKDAEGEAHYLGNVAALFSFIGVVVLLMGLLIYPFLGNIFDKFTEEELGIYKVLYLLTLFNTSFMFPARTLSGISAARQKYIIPGCVALITSVTSSAGIIVLLSMGYKSIALVTLGIVTGILTLCWNIYYCFGMLKARISWNGLDIPLCKSMFAFSFWMFLDHLISIFNWGCGNFVMGMTQGAAAIAVYTYGLHLMNIYYTWSNCVAGLFLPRVVKVVQTSNSNKELSDMWIRVGRVQFMSLCLMLTGIIFFGRSFFTLWIGDTMGSSTDTSWCVAVILMSAITLPLLQTLGWQILQARNVMRFRVSVLLVISFLNLLLGYVLSKWFGAVGLAVGTAASFIIGQGFFMNYLYKRRVGLEVGRFFKSCLRRSIPLLLVLLLAGGGLCFVLQQNLSWFCFCACVVAYTVFYAFAVSNIYAGDAELKLMPVIIRKLLTFNRK